MKITIQKLRLPAIFVLNLLSCPRTTCSQTGGTDECNRETNRWFGEIFVDG
jgi:hypothetical protein